VVPEVNSSNRPAAAGSTVGPRLIVSSRHLRNQKRIFVLGINLISFCGCIVAIYQLGNSAVGLLEIGLLLLMYTLAAVGVSVGFHRHFSHNSFKTLPAIRNALAILGSMAAVGPVISWVATHRCHHQHSDLPNDPHSPNSGGTGAYNRARGIWHAHLGWLLDATLPNSFIFAKDLLADPAISRINRLYLYWVLAGLAIPALLGGLLTSTWAGVFQGFLWGGLVRMFLGFHAACSVNSITHSFGNSPFCTGEHSKNLGWLALPTFGESWHNNHHAFSNSAKFGLEWWQVDLGYLVVHALEKLGLAWNVKMPTRERIDARRRNAGALQRP